MGFFQRLATTLRADANGLIDAVEEPTLLLKQHLRDAELAVQQKKAELARLDGEAKRLGADRQRAEAESARLERDAELALAQERDDLVRHSLGLLLPKQRLSERIAARLATIAEERTALHGTLEGQEVALEELRARVQAFIANRAGGCADAAWEPVTDEQIEIELLRRKAAKRADAERSEAEAPEGAR